MVTSSFATTLFTADIPQDVRTGEFAMDKVDAFGDALTTIAERLDVQAVEVFKACVARARENAHGASAQELRNIVAAAEPVSMPSRARAPKSSLHSTKWSARRRSLTCRCGSASPAPRAPTPNTIGKTSAASSCERDFARARTAYERARWPSMRRVRTLITTWDCSSNSRQKPWNQKAAVDHYDRAIQRFVQASTRATGALRSEAMERMRLAQRTLL